MSLHEILDGNSFYLTISSLYHFPCIQYLLKSPPKIQQDYKICKTKEQEKNAKNRVLLKRKSLKSYILTHGI